MRNLISRRSESTLPDLKAWAKNESCCILHCFVIGHSYFQNVDDDYVFSEVYKMIAIDRSVGSDCEEVEIVIPRLSGNT